MLGLGPSASRPLASASHTWRRAGRRWYYGQLEPGQDTIYAPSTAPGRAAVQIVRIAGSRAREVYGRLTTSPSSSVDQDRRRPPAHRLAQLRRIRHPATGETLDHHALSLFFPSASSACGDPTLELHLHGSPAVLRSVLSALSSLDASSPHQSGRLRPAEPGEFTRRAFLNGKMDLTEVEGLRDLIEAETEGQRKMALRMAEGHSRKVFERINGQLREARAMLEAIIDFSETEELEDGVWDRAQKRIVLLRQTLVGYLEDSKRCEVTRSGIRVGIFGPPNGGKSTLLNWLAQREASIVSAHPGTTRDVIELSLDFHGHPIIIADTAGLRETADDVESLGIERARNKILSSDLKICVLPLDDPGAASDPSVQGLLSEAAGEAGRMSFRVSVLTGAGLPELVAGLRSILAARYSPTESPLVTNSRQAHHLSLAVAGLDACLAFRDARDIVFAVEELNESCRAIARVTGEVSVDDVLGEIFSQFCIGK